MQRIHQHYSRMSRLTGATCYQAAWCKMTRRSHYGSSTESSKKTSSSRWISRRAIRSMPMGRMQLSLSAHWVTSESWPHHCKNSSLAALFRSYPSKRLLLTCPNPYLSSERHRWSAPKLRIFVASCAIASTCSTLMPCNCLWIHAFSKSSSIAKWSTLWSKHLLLPIPYTD